MANLKIEKKQLEIAKIEAKIAESNEKIRELKREITALENEDIVALFRKEKINEEELSAFLHAQRKKDNGDT